MNETERYELAEQILKMVPNNQEGLSVLRYAVEVELQRREMSREAWFYLHLTPSQQRGIVASRAHFLPRQERKGKLESRWDVQK